MALVNLTLVPAAFSVTPTWTVEEFHQALVASITSLTTDSDVILGQVGGTAPATNIGPWLHGTTWYAWDSGSSTYKPATIKVGDASFQVTLAGTPTANRTITLPDKDGILATTTDVYTGRGTVTLSGTTPDIDWSAGSSFAENATATPVVPTISNSLPGQEIKVAFYNGTGGAMAITWPVAIKWVSAPANPATTKTSVYILNNIGGTVYGRIGGTDY